MLTSVELSTATHQRWQAFLEDKAKNKKFTFIYSQ